MRQRRGYTLIELMTIVVVIGLLAAIALPRYWHVRERAVVAMVESDLRNLAVAQEVYHDQRQAYAASVAELQAAQLSPGIEVVVSHATATGWAAHAWHTSTPARACGFYMGDAPASGATPATAPGVVACE